MKQEHYERLKLFIPIIKSIAKGDSYQMTPFDLVHQVWVDIGNQRIQECCNDNRVNLFKDMAILIEEYEQGITKG